MADELEQLVNDLKSQANLDSMGQFTLDAAKAREKFALRQQREAGLWLVKLIQSAHLWEASRLQLRQERLCARAIINLNKPLDIRPWLAHLQDITMFTDPLYGPVATAFQAALADGCSAVEINSLLCDAENIAGNYRASEPSENLHLRFIYKRKQPWWNPLLHLRPPRRSLENFLAARQKAGLALPKIDIDRLKISAQESLEKVLDSDDSHISIERVWLSAAPAKELMLYPAIEQRQTTIEEINGQPALTGQNRNSPSLRQWRHETLPHLPQPDNQVLNRWLEKLQLEALVTPPPSSQDPQLAVRGLLFWSPGRRTPATILPLKYGIQLEAVPFTSLPPGVTIWLSCSRWNTDLHQKKVVHDEIFQQLCHWCIQQFDSLLTDITQMLHSAQWDNEPLGSLRQVLNQTNLRPRPTRETQPFPTL